MREKRKGLKGWEIIVAMAGLLLLATCALSGCTEPVAIAAVEPTATLYAPPPTDIPPPPPGPAPAALAFPLPPANHVHLEEVDDQACVACHTSEETLKAVAEKEDTAHESLSEGEG
jgi:hypothetical protein